MRDTPQAIDDVLTVKETAKRLRVSHDSIRRWIVQGRIEIIRLSPRIIRIPWRQFAAKAVEQPRRTPKRKTRTT